MTRIPFVPFNVPAALRLGRAALVCVVACQLLAACAAMSADPPGSAPEAAMPLPGPDNTSP